VGDLDDVEAELSEGGRRAVAFHATPDWGLQMSVVRMATTLPCATVLSRIDHIGVAVEDLDAAIELYQQTYGMALVHRETVRGTGVEAVLLDVGEPRGAPAPARPGHAGGEFLRAQGPAAPRRLPVTDIEATLAALRDARAGSSTSPATGIRSSRVAFLHPAATGAVLTELVQPAEGH
jgi:methylmalonyl-CoA/ethylmalonyl-CoA epimerase